MRKHIYGFALFVFIVACGVTAYALFMPRRWRLNTSSKYCPKRISGGSQRHPDPILESPKPGPLSYKIKSFHIDLETGLGTVEVQLDWDSGEKPPAGVRLDFGLTTPGEPYSGTDGRVMVMSTSRLKKGMSVTKTCLFKTSGRPRPEGQELLRLCGSDRSGRNRRRYYEDRACREKPDGRGNTRADGPSK